MTYRLQNRYQDSGWQDLDNEQFEYAGDAIMRADELSENAIAYGMVRVVRNEDGAVIREFAAGHRPH